MLFNSSAFFVFFAVVYLTYVSVSHRWQNRLLLVASCFFYAVWSRKFLALLLFSITFDWSVGLLLERFDDQRRRKLLLASSITTNLVILGFFKYYNFFVDNLTQLFSRLGIDARALHLNLVLPVGISFYSFHMISYVVDVYHRRLHACKSYVDYALFVTYFPQLVSGPIARAESLLPQVERERRILPIQVVSGVFWVGWGLFKKVVIADGCAFVVNAVFDHDGAHGGLDKLIAVYAFALQIYGDFSGYSDMARGLAKLMGFELLLNFNLPYFAESPSDFWKRWHISLSSWLRDYLYIPLGGNRHGDLQMYRNLFLTMLIGGIWHGASWTMLIWGAYHGLLLIAYRLLNVKDTSTLPLRGRIFKVLLMFHFTCLGWVFFRANSVSQAGRFLRDIVINLHSGPQTWSYVKLLLPLGASLFFVQLLQIRGRSLELFERWSATKRTAFAIALVWLTVAHLIFHQSLIRGNKPFLYFQF